MTLFEKNWELVKDLSFLNLILLESHNACSKNVDYRSIVASDNETIAGLNALGTPARAIIGIKRICDQFAKTQTLSISDQLIKSGVRSLDIRVTQVEGVLMTHHTFMSQSFKEIITEVVHFLEQYPLEIVQLKIKWTDTQKQSLMDSVEKILTETSSIKFSVTRDNRYKTIEHLVSIGQRLMIFVDGDQQRTWNTGLLSEYLDRYIDTNQSSEKVNRIEHQLSLLNQFGGNSSRSLYTINYTLTPQTEDYTKNVIRCCGIGSKTGSLHDINATLPQLLPLSSRFPNSWFKANSVSIDFVQDNSELATSLLLLVKLLF